MGLIDNSPRSNKELLLYGFHFYQCITAPQWAKTPSLPRTDDHTQLATPQTVGLLWTSYQPVAETFT